MIEPMAGFPEGVIALRAHGRVSARDYETVVTPAVETALKNHDKIRLFYEFAADFTGIEAGAMWEDFAVGVSHLTRWERVAVVTDVDWIAHAVRAFSFMIPAKVKAFSLAEDAAARAWIAAA